MKPTGNAFWSLPNPPIGRIAKSVAIDRPWDNTKNDITDMGLFIDTRRVCKQWCQYIGQHDIHLSGDGSPIHATHLALLAVNNIQQHRSWTFATVEKWFHLMTDRRRSPAFLGRSWSRPKQKKFDEQLEGEEDLLSLIRTLLDDIQGESEHAIQTHANAGANYAFAHLDSGYIGRVHNTCQEGDQVYLLAGADMPVVLRSCGQDGTARVVAPAFVVSAMDGELWSEDETKLEGITLV